MTAAASSLCKKPLLPPPPPPTCLPHDVLQRPHRLRQRFGLLLAGTPPPKGHPTTGSPLQSSNTQRNHLKSFMGQPGGDYFTKYWLESTSNVPRIRKKCVKTILDPSTTPNTQKSVKTVFGKISKQSPGILTTIDDDLEFENSQDAVAQLSLLYGDD